MTDSQFVALTGLIGAVVTALIYVVKAGIKAQEEDRKNAQVREERHVGIIEKFGGAYEDIATNMKDMTHALERQADAMKQLAESIVRKQHD